MRISDWSSDVCSSDLSFFQPFQRSAREEWTHRHRRQPAASVLFSRRHNERGSLISDALPSTRSESIPAAPTPAPFCHPVKTHPACARSEEHPSELHSLMRTSSAVVCLNKKNRPYNLQTYK